MKNISNISLGWKGSQANNFTRIRQTMIKQKSRFDFWLSIIIVFLIIFVISQLIASLDQHLRQSLAARVSLLINPLKIQSASAATINEAKFMIQSQKDIQMLPNTKTMVQIGFKNNGPKTWFKSGSGKVEIFLKKNSTLIKRGELAVDSIQSGQIGYFDLQINSASTIGNYTYQYILARNGKEILSGSTFYLKVKVVNKLDNIAKPVAVNNAVAIKTTADKPATAKIEVKAAELVKPEPAGRLCLEYSVKKFILNNETQKIVDQCQQIGVDLLPNAYIEKDGNFVLASTIASAPVSKPAPSTAPSPTPTPTSTPSAIPAVESSDGPIIRVGLYSTTEPILFTANQDYKIVDQNNVVLARVTSGMTTTLTFNFSNRTYSFNANGQSMATNSYLRLEPETAGTIFEISSLFQIPAWNQNLNFNKFLGKLEVRYSPNTNKLWVINELPLEQYLKGLAETSNGSPIEYQKALITAARTYALYHLKLGTKHAAEYYTLDATYDQVYRGYGSQLKQTQVSEAVEATRGIVVTYNGEVVVTPYFSHSDGRTRSWTEVWGGSAKPWCVSVKEPANYDKTTLWGHGVGLSAHGALHLAYYYNYTFDNILKYYYTGIELKKIY